MAPGVATVDCWRIVLTAGEDSLVGLSAEETERARRFRYARDRKRYATAHRALRGILAQVTGRAAASLRFAYGPHGKPDMHPPCDLHFNLSHSGDLAVVAVTTTGPVGVDVEAVRPSADLDAVAASHFSPRERDALAARPLGERADAFFRIWTRKEAYIKALGTGLSHPLEAFSVTHTAHEARILEIDGDAARASRWAMADLPLPADVVGAVTLEAPALALVMHDWDG